MTVVPREARILRWREASREWELLYGTTGRHYLIVSKTNRGHYRARGLMVEVQTGPWAGLALLAEPGASRLPAPTGNDH